MERWKIPVRKFAHYLLFASGGLVIYLILECFCIKHRLIIAIFLGLLFACADEFHQLYSLNRGPGFLDVVIDTIRCDYWRNFGFYECSVLPENLS